MAAINKALEWITRLAYLNMLCIGFTIVGAVIFGLFPSVVATFAVTRKWVLGETDVPVFKTFWKSYKSEFVKSNILGFILSLVGYVLYLDFVFVNAIGNNLGLILTIPFLIISIIYILTMFYVFPVYVHYDMKLTQVVKNSFFIMFMNPLTTIIMLFGFSGITYMLWNFQGLMIFFSISVLATVIMMSAYRAFDKVNKKQKLLLQNSN
ncbi:YesL family protein [Aquibacillus rhizosphaerae]|uniref:YesL family protein n=1 Tax=Aquibacillus rhizosphaerae TaxID=3051431 RepID=A0ABT7L0K8_9BACI|nr:YesL family protein [Aquibacillus sp. LR5S19]MDL4839333.1 YesL family protein [Aquibacillus sp. LR5S19]